MQRGIVRGVGGGGTISSQTTEMKGGGTTTVNGRINTIDDYILLPFKCVSFFRERMCFVR